MEITPSWREKGHHTRAIGFKKQIGLQIKKEKKEKEKKAAQVEMMAFRFVASSEK